MKQEWRRGDDPINSYKVSYGDVRGKPIGSLHRIPDTNKKKRDEAQDFFAQEKLLIEYWVSITLFWKQENGRIAIQELE